MIASAQGGEHPGGRRTWGHSMIVDPWGAVVDEHDKGAGLAEAVIDPERQRDIRRRFPVLEHRRDIENNLEY
jgi:nitrilase